VLCNSGIHSVSDRPKKSDSKQRSNQPVERGTLSRPLTGVFMSKFELVLLNPVTILAMQTRRCTSQNSCLAFMPYYYMKQTKHELSNTENMGPASLLVIRVFQP
jgi:hypothetical protein